MSRGKVPVVETTIDALAEAATLAGYAPSIHNSQPWRWRVADGVLDLHLAHERQLPSTDPDARLAVLSAGTALHHARTAMAAEGLDAHVVRLPDPDDPGHLARITIAGRLPVSPAAMRLVQTMRIRHTDRRPVTEEPVGADELTTVVDAVHGEGAWLHILHRDEVIELAAAASYAQQAEAADDTWQAELAYWTGGLRPDGVGVPDAVIPAEATQTTVPSRDFGHHGSLLVSSNHDQGASFAILYGPEDSTADWLRAGESLSAGWLAATELGLSLVPLSATVEVPYTRQTLSRLVVGLGSPYLVIRLGHPDPAHAGPPHTPRLRAEQIIERV